MDTNQHQQMYLFERPLRKVKWGELECPFGDRYVRDEISHAGRFAYYDIETARICWTPHLLRLQFFTDPDTGKMVSDWRLPDWEKKRREAQLAKWTTDVADVSEPAPKKRTRKGTKWSREAKARNRQRLLRQRVEKAICGKRHYSETLFSEQLKAEIEAEYQKRLSQNPDYFEGVDVYKDGEDD